MNFNKTLKSLLRPALSVVVASLMWSGGGAFAADHDGDGESDLTVYRPVASAIGVEGVWYFNSTLQNLTFDYQWGLNGDYPVSGNYFSSTGADFAVWRPADGTWYIRKYDSGLDFSSAAGYQWGLSGDRPVPCDFNNDGFNEVAVWRPSSGTWYLRLSTTNPSTTYATAIAQQWGSSSDTPIPYDYDMDGKCDYTVFRNGTWSVILSSGTTSSSSDTATVTWGTTGDVPVPGQWTTDTISDFAVYRSRTAAQGSPIWVIRKSNLAGLTTSIYQWGLQGDLPVPMDYDGDGKTDLAVWRPSDGVWYIRTSSSNYATAVASQFGLTGDIPLGDRRGSDPS